MSYKLLPYPFNKYGISKEGTVISYKYKNHKIVKPQIKNGYVIVTLMDDSGNKKYFSVHRLVASAYIPNTENKPEVNHIDHNRSNNNVENLEWCTSKENSKKRKPINRNIKFTMEDVHNMYGLSKTKTMNELSEIYGVDRSTINKILVFMHPTY